MGRRVAHTARWAVLALLVSQTSATRGDTPSPANYQSETEALATLPQSEQCTQQTRTEQTLFRHTTYPAAWTAAQESNRPILVFVSMPGCPHCVEMMKKTYNLPEVGQLVTDSFETMYAGKYTHANLIQKLHVRWYPTTILVGTNNKILDVIEGYVDANTFKRRLQMGLAEAGSATHTR